MDARRQRQRRGGNARGAIGRGAVNRNRQAPPTARVPVAVVENNREEGVNGARRAVEAVSAANRGESDGARGGRHRRPAGPKTNMFREPKEAQAFRREVMRHFKCPFHEEGGCKYDAQPDRCLFSHGVTPKVAMAPNDKEGSEKMDTSEATNKPNSGPGDAHANDAQVHDAQSDLKEVPSYACVYSLLNKCRNRQLFFQRRVRSLSGAIPPGAPLTPRPTVKPELPKTVSKANCTSGLHLSPEDLVDLEHFEAQYAGAIDAFYAGDRDRECSICFEKVLGKKVPKKRRFGMLVACTHVFCAPCITEWRSRSKNCPVCRTPSDKYAIAHRWTEEPGAKETIFKKVKVDPPGRATVGGGNDALDEANREALEMINELNFFRLNANGHLVLDGPGPVDPDSSDFDWAAAADAMSDSDDGGSSHSGLSALERIGDGSNMMQDYYDLFDREFYEPRYDDFEREYGLPEDFDDDDGGRFEVDLGGGVIYDEDEDGSGFFISPPGFMEEMRDQAQAGAVAPAAGAGAGRARGRDATRRRREEQVAARGRAAAAPRAGGRGEQAQGRQRDGAQAAEPRALTFDARRGRDRAQARDGAQVEPRVPVGAARRGRVQARPPFEASRERNGQPAAGANNQRPTWAAQEAANIMGFAIGYEQLPGRRAENRVRAGAGERNVAPGPRNNNSNWDLPGNNGNVLADIQLALENNGRGGRDGARGGGGRGRAGGASSAGARGRGGAASRGGNSGNANQRRGGGSGRWRN